MPPRRVPLLWVNEGRAVRPDATKGWVRLADAEKTVEMGRRLFGTHESLYVVDVDGQFSGVADLELYQTLERQRVFPWVDAGCRKPEDAMDILFAGAEAMTIQLRHMEPAMLQEVTEMAEADLHIGLTVDASGLEKRLRSRDVVELSQRVGAKGVVLYEGEGGNFHAAENAGFDFLRAGLSSTWVARPGSVNTPRAAASDRFTTLVDWEAPK